MDKDQAASNLADRKELCGVVKMKDFYRQKGAGTRKSYQAKKQVGYCKVTFL